jgi:hypothetical protein
VCLPVTLHDLEEWLFERRFAIRITLLAFMQLFGENGTRLTCAADS